MAEISLKILPFAVPIGVLLEPPPSSRANGFKPAAEIPLGALSRKAVIALCAEFQAAVLARWEQQNIATQVQNNSERLFGILQDDPT
jgi:hypothetical protein